VRWNLVICFLPVSCKNKCAKLAIAVLTASEGAEKSPANVRWTFDRARAKEAKK